MNPTLALFDLDHTLLSGDSDDLWCRFAVRWGLVPEDRLLLNEEMGQGYRDGSVSAADFSDFYAGLLAGRTPADWLPWRERFLAEEISPRIPPAARALVEQHRAQGHRLIMTTASNRVLTELTASALAFDHLITTEVECGADGCYTGRTEGTLNMREGKLVRLRSWLQAHGLSQDLLRAAWFYSDSANDIPLLQAVGHPVAVDPDGKLRALAESRGWPVLQLDRSA